MISPQNYQQWLDFFTYLYANPMNYKALDLVEEGTFNGDVSEEFLEELSKAVAMLLTVHCKRFLKKVDEAYIDNDFEFIAVLVVRLRQNIIRSLFYRKLNFLSREHIKSLDAGFHKQIDSFWINFMNELSKDFVQKASSESESLMLFVKRINLLRKEDTVNG